MSILSPHFLAIDQGGHASRALVFDAAGRIVASASVDVGTRRTPGEIVEHDPEELIESIRSTLAEAADSFGARGDLTAAGLATQRSSIVCWDRETGAALSPVISWQDRRAADWLRQFKDRSEKIHALTGLVLSPHYGASKLRWCLDHLPEVRRALDAGRLAAGPLASFILFRLLEERPLATDPANGSRTLLWDCSTRNWSEELLELFGVPASVLPRCVPTRHAYGTLPIGSRRVPLGVCTGDQSAALFAFGEPHPDTVYVNAGTGAFLQRAIGGQRIESPQLLGSVVWQSGAELSYVLEGTVNGAGSAIRRVAEEIGVAADALDTEVIRSLESVSEPPLYLNGISGLGSPFWRADFPSRFVGDGGTRQQLAAVVESIVFLIMANLEEMTRAAGPMRRLVLTGGLSALDQMCRKLADLSGLTVERPDVQEATARGLAWLVAGRPQSWAGALRAVRFEPKGNAALKSRFERWRAALADALS
jgi:glycerol kinase